jgi:acyl-ACP thioesterase
LTGKLEECGPGASRAAVSLFSLLQRAAAEHAEALGVGGDALRRDGLAWILVQWSLEIFSLPEAGSTVRIETWPSGYTDRIVRRDFFVDSPSGVRIGRATSHWAILDLARRRPVQMPGPVRSLTTTAREAALDAPLSRLPAPDPPAFTQSVRVTAEHLDANGHVNNVRYVEWLLASLPGETLARPLAAFEVSFRAEAREGETLDVSWGEDAAGPSGSGIFRHRIASGPRAVALARSVFLAA